LPGELKVFPLEGLTVAVGVGTTDTVVVNVTVVADAVVVPTGAVTVIVSVAVPAPELGEGSVVIGSIVTEVGEAESVEVGESDEESDEDDLCL